MKRPRLTSLALGAGAIAIALTASADAAAAQQFVYRPTNPAFGGNPLNQQWLLSTAEAQRPSDTTDLFSRDPLADFQDGLQRQVLSAISRELVTNRFGDDLDLTQEGRYDIGGFVVDILPGLNGVDIKVINSLTGDQTTVTIPHG
ncbi:curli production assembly/transport component CsgF [Gaopeijia maritima]|uniref:Curli production assembly/transport component CsgF n=1 Tax=Gaopeijia maritima TaxID=3119007 RepID=A0ABU9E7P0_9BACT